MSNSKRPRVDIDAIFLSDCVYSAVVNSNYSKLPICKYALAHLLLSDFSGPVQSHISALPNYFGYLRTYLTNQNFNRVINQVRCIAKNQNVSETLKACYRSAQISLAHDNSGPLMEGVPCSVCFVTSNSNVADTMESRCTKFVNDFTQNELNRGKSLAEIYSCICSTSHKILSTYDLTLVCFENSLEELRESFDAYRTEVKNNLAKFSKHLNEVSAVIHYGSGLSRSGVQHLDRTIFCTEFTKNEIEQYVSTLPDCRYIKSSDPTVNLGDLFNEYCSYVLNYNAEPSFLKLGQKYKLVGRVGGSSGTCLSYCAQSVCLNYLLRPVNHGIFNELRPILAVNSNMRSRYKPHPLVEDLNYPRIPSIRTADEQVEQLRSSNSILLGTALKPVDHVGWDIIKSCPKMVVTNARLVDLISIRENSLNFQSKNNFLRGKPPQHYQSIPIKEVKSKLKSYSLICENDFNNHDEQYLRKKLQEAECTRNFAMWYDHAIILNRSYILFTVRPVFSESVYYSDKLCKGDLQKAVEQIYVHYVAMCPSTTKSEEALHEFRMKQLASLKVKIKSPCGVEFTDKLKFILGDAPVRSVENGMNKSGPYRNPTLLEGFPLDDKNYYQIMGFEHMTLEKTTKHANKGGFFDNPENHGKSLQDLTDNPASAKELMKIRWPYKRTENMSSDEIKQFLKKELGGTRRPPIYFMKHPKKLHAEISLDNAELVPVEPLHDLKGDTTKSLKLIPGPQDDDTLKSIHELITNTCNFDFESKHEKSGETIFKNLIEVVQKFELKYFPERLSCNNCGKIFTLSTVKRCPKCLYYTYYRSLLEVHIFGYKDESKRTGSAALLLNNLIFVMFQSLKEIISTIPDASKVINSIYFIDTVFYMGPTFELTNFLSVHAGSMEDIFRQLKDYALSFTNRRHFQESFLLNVIKRHEVSRFFKSSLSFKTNRSTVSAAVTAFHERSPIPNVVLTKDFIEANPRDFAAHIRRISNFVVSNTSTRYMSLSSNNDLEFLSFRKCTTLNCDHSCSSCLSLLFPDFPIHNILNSSIEIILNAKANIFKEIACKIIVGGKIDFAKFRQVIGLAPLPNATILLSSSEILNDVGIERQNPSRQLLPANYSSMLKILLDIDPSNPEKYEKIGHSIAAKCVAKILNHVPDQILALDNSSRRLSSRSANLAQDSNETNRHFHHLELGYYISRATDAIDLISARLVSHQKDIDNLSRIVDKIICGPNSSECTEDNKFVKILRQKQKFKLIALEILSNFTYEVNIHNYLMYRPL